MMPSILSDGNIVVNDSGFIAVFHTTAQGQWAEDPDPDQPQLPGGVRYRADSSRESQRAERQLRPSCAQRKGGIGQGPSPVCVFRTSWASPQPHQSGGAGGFYAKFGARGGT